MRTLQVSRPSTLFASSFALAVERVHCHLHPRLFELQELCLDFQTRQSLHQTRGAGERFSSRQFSVQDVEENRPVTCPERKDV